jgi:hypothetical protein
MINDNRHRHPLDASRRASGPDGLPAEDRRVRVTSTVKTVKAGGATALTVSQPKPNVFQVSGTIAADAGPTLRIGEIPNPARSPGPRSSGRPAGRGDGHRAAYGRQPGRSPAGAELVPADSAGGRARVGQPGGDREGHPEDQPQPGRRPHSLPRRGGVGQQGLRAGPRHRAAVRQQGPRGRPDRVLPVRRRRQRRSRPVGRDRIQHVPASRRRALRRGVPSRAARPRRGRRSGQPGSRHSCRRSRLQQDRDASAAEPAGVGLHQRPHADRLHRRGVGPQARLLDHGGRCRSIPPT